MYNYLELESMRKW